MASRFLLLALALATGTAASAEGILDYSAGFGLRTLPRGTAIAAEVGYGLPIWGTIPTPPADPTDFLYGYGRPYARVQSSVVVNRFDFGLNIAPISFLSFSVNQGFVQRGTETATLDCTVLECEGTLYKTRVGAHLTLGYGPVYLLWDLSSETQSLQSGKTTLRFGDESSALAGRAGGDTLSSSSLILGTKLGGPWSTGVMAAAAAMKESGSNSTIIGAFGRWSDRPWAVDLLLGSYRSSTQKPAFTAGAALTWTPARSIGLR